MTEGGIQEKVTNRLHCPLDTIIRMFCCCCVREVLCVNKIFNNPMITKKVTYLPTFFSKTTRL